jgi:uncharacterized protein YjhX (UPF0386 family)
LLYSHFIHIYSKILHWDKVDFDLLFYAVQDIDKGKKMENIKQVFNSFDILGDFISAEHYGNGHINDTYKVLVSQGGTSVPYLFQRINHNIFKEPEKLMDNISRICRHLQDTLVKQNSVAKSRNVMTLISSTEGNPYVIDSDGYSWRVYIFIEEATGFDIIETEKQAFEAARAFGQYQNYLSDLPGERLYETIPDFHNTEKRFKNFQQVVDKDAYSLCAGLEEEISFFLSFRDDVSFFTDCVKNGILPERVTHNDTKLNNVLLDNVTGEATCVIDLDTSMPGLAAYDFGDLVRTSTCFAAEDEKDLSKVIFEKKMFEALLRGYLSTAITFLTLEEVKSLVFGAILMTFEVGMRFLTDYLEGNIYFKIKYPDQNLVRSRTQMALVKCLQKERDELEELTLSVYHEIKSSTLVKESM